MSTIRHITIICIAAGFLLASASPAYAMHIAEGILPLPWAAFWYLAALPFVVKGMIDIKRGVKSMPAFVPLVGMMSAALFIISAMPIPVPTAGTCSHPAGTGLAAILVGPYVTVIATSIALLIQALFLAHGGITTWGADIFSMGVAGALSGFIVFRLCVRLNLPLVPAAFLAGLVSDWATYATTSLELALGLGGAKSFVGLFKAISIAFIPTQLPLGILEGFAAAGFFAFMLKRRPDILVALGVLPRTFALQGDVAHE